MSEQNVGVGSATSAVLQTTQNYESLAAELQGKVIKLEGELTREKIETGRLRRYASYLKSHVEKLDGVKDIDDWQG